MKIHRRKWFPVASLDDKQNFKRMNRIQPDGSIIESVYLHVPDIRYREYLIFMHYIQHLVRHFIQDDVGMNILNRDNPWDFEVELSTGSRFNIEITSIADNRQQFKNNSREERLEASRSCEMISLRELSKLADFFPSNEVNRLVMEYRTRGIDSEEMVRNPYYRDGTNIVVSVVYETDDDLSSLLIEAIEKKAEKGHPRKENTILIIDNRTGQYDLPDYFAALDCIRDRITDLPFPEIWFYTGYYSDYNGDNAEFSFAPIKVTNEQAEILNAMQSETDPEGIYYSKRSDDA